MPRTYEWMPSAPISTSPWAVRRCEPLRSKNQAVTPLSSCVKAAEPMAGVQPAFAEPRAHRLMDHALQPAAMHRELRHVVARVDAARLAPDLLAEPVGVDQLVGADRDRVEPLHQAELLQLLDGMRQRVDADAELADALGLLEQLAVDAAGMQHQGRGKPADSAADDNDLHETRPSDATNRNCRERIIGRRPGGLAIGSRLRG